MADRVIVAMSGGVDSSAAAALLLEAGYEVVGVTLRIWEPPQSKETKEDIPGVNDARRVAEKLGRSEEHTSELQSRPHLVCRLLLEKKKNNNTQTPDVTY